MKKFFTLFAMVMMTMLYAQAQTLPIYVTELIDEAPAGTVVSDCVRSGYSYFYQNQSLQGGYNGGFSGEYVIGDDGCIYLKKPCASLDYNSYIKLDKVDDETYVAHTAQCAYVYDASTSVYVYYATRLVFNKMSDYQYTYSLEKNDDGQYVTDVYFTFKDGVLKQRDQEVVDMNGQIFPHELIGLTNSTGGWIGYGDGCIIVENVTDTPVVLPEGAEVKDGSFAYNRFSSAVKGNIRDALKTQYAEVGDDYYVLSPLDGKNWIKGSIDRAANTVTFKKQYAGVYDAIDCHEWFTPCVYADSFDEWDPEDHTGSWDRAYKEVAEYVCAYEDGNIVSDPSNKQAFVFTMNKDALQISGAYADATVKSYTDRLATPVTPQVTHFEPVESSGWWGELWFVISPVDENDVYINTNELYYNVYFNDATTPFTFVPDNYTRYHENMTDVAYNYDDDMDFDMNGAFHNLYFYTEGVKYAGIQAIHKHNGEVAKSEIAWYNNNVPSGIKDVDAVKTGVQGKWLEDGKIVIMKNGKKYNVNGQNIR